MSCDCRQTSQKMFSRLDRSTTPPTLRGQAVVSIEAYCLELPGNDEDEKMLLDSSPFDQAVLLGLYGRDARRPGQTSQSDLEPTAETSGSTSDKSKSEARISLPARPLSSPLRTLD